MSEPVVETQELAVRFGGVLAVDHVNFVLRERELRCFVRHLSRAARRAKVQILAHFPAP